jgi:hypothetical protein
LKFIQKDREKKGLVWSTRFHYIAEKNIESIKEGTVREVKSPNQKTDIIRYDTLDSIDKCLDTINDLTILHKMFGDESYLQLKELVTERLILLSK